MGRKYFGNQGSRVCESVDWIQVACYGLQAGSCHRGNEPCSSIKRGRYFVYHPCPSAFKKDFSPWNENKNYSNISVEKGRLVHGGYVQLSSYFPF
jgi:hypothetical protein